MRKTTIVTCLLLSGALLFGASNPVGGAFAIQPGGGTSSTGALGRCKLVMIPEAQLGNISYAAVAWEEGANSVKYTIKPTDNNKIELGTIGGAYFQAGGNDLDDPIDPTKTTELTFTFNGNSVAVTGKVNDVAITPQYDYDKRGVRSSLGEAPSPELVSFGHRKDGSPWRRERVLFEYYGLLTGFSLLDME